MKNLLPIGLTFVLLLASGATAQVEQAWSREIEEVTPQDQTFYWLGETADFAVDDDGNVYVATNDGSDDEPVALLVKYDPDGDPLWTATYDGDGSGLVDAFRAVALDSEGDVYVTGLSYTQTSQFSEMVTQKYDGATGALLWSHVYDSFESGDSFAEGIDVGTAIAVDAQDDVYAAGTSKQGLKTFTSDDFILFKYDADGDVLWMQTFDETAGEHTSTDLLADMTADAAGNAYLTGAVQIAFSGNENFRTLKYAPDGSLLWSRLHDTPGSTVLTDTPEAVAVDASGNVVVTGTVALASEDGGRDVFTITYSPTGDILWADQFDNGHGALRNNDFAEALAVDSEGNVLVTGKSQQADDAFDDYLTIKYDADGTRLWTRRYNGLANQHDIPRAVTTDADGTVYVSGTTTGIPGGGSSGSDFGTIAYSPAGDSLWIVTKDPPTNGSTDTPLANAVDAEGNVYVLGVEGLFDSANLLTVKYEPSSTSVEPVPSAPPERVALHPGYPNPAAATTRIPFDVSAPTRVRLTVHDPLGRTVAVPADGAYAAGRYEVVFDARGLAAGVYLLRLETSRTVETQRLSVVR